MNTNELEAFWSNRYQENNTGWDIGYPSTPIKTYVDQLEDKAIRILIPGAGNGYEAEYLFRKGFHNTHVLDIAKAPLTALKNRVPEFPEDQLIHGNFFEHHETYDLIIEQTFFCALLPHKRQNYATQMSQLLQKGQKLVGLWFTHELNKAGKRPFGGSKEEYLTYLSPYFDIKTFTPCYNSIKPRENNELFGIFVRK